MADRNIRRYNLIGEDSLDNSSVQETINDNHPRRRREAPICQPLRSASMQTSPVLAVGTADLWDYFRHAISSARLVRTFKVALPHRRRRL